MADPTLWLLNSKGEPLEVFDFSSFEMLYNHLYRNHNCYRFRTKSVARYYVYNISSSEVVLLQKNENFGYFVNWHVDVFFLEREKKTS